MKTFGWSVGAALALGAAAMAQTGVAPVGLTNSAGGTGFNTLIRVATATTGDFSRVHQVIWSQSALAGAGIQPGYLITGLAYRSNSRAGATAEGTWPESAVTFPDYEIRMGLALTTPASMSTTYANNFSGAPTLVHDGALVIAPQSYATGPIQTAGATPRPFGPGITLQSAFLYTGGDLVIETRLQAGTGLPAIANSSNFLDSVNGAAQGLGSLVQSVGSAGFTSAAGTLVFTAPAVTQFSFIIPTPGSLAVLGMGGLLAARRRR